MIKLAKISSLKKITLERTISTFSPNKLDFSTKKKPRISSDEFLCVKDQQISIIKD